MQHIHSHECAVGLVVWGSINLISPSLFNKSHYVYAQLTSLCVLHSGSSAELSILVPAIS